MAFARHISCVLRVSLATLVVIATPVGAIARSSDTDARAGITAFSQNCFSPRMTAARAADVLNVTNVRYDFYDLDPFIAQNDPSPVTGRAATKGTDRRCEVSFDGDFRSEAANGVFAALEREGIRQHADVPANHEALRTNKTALLAARRLNPRKIAVVHVGTRPGPNDIEETFIYVERLRSPQ